MTVEMQHDKVAWFWDAYRAGLSAHQSARLPDFPDARSFGDNPGMVDELGAQVLGRVKTAACGLLWEYQHECEALPQAGDQNVILAGASEPLCLIETLEVRVVPYDQVDARFAYDEGEGDRSLAFWRAEHWKYFSRCCARMGCEPAMDMPLVCKRFRVIASAQINYTSSSEEP